MLLLPELDDGLPGYLVDIVGLLPELSAGAGEEAEDEGLRQPAGLLMVCGLHIIVWVVQKKYHLRWLGLRVKRLTVLAIRRTLNSPPLCFFSKVLARLLRPLRLSLRY